MALSWVGLPTAPNSQIRARVWTWDEKETVGDEFFCRRIAAAVKARKPFFSGAETGALRLVHGESDGLPGLVIDRYGQWAVVQFLSCGPEHWREAILAALRDSIDVSGIYERSDVDVRKLEGLEERTGMLWGLPLPDDFCIPENGLNFRIDIIAGHKTGFYLDQRENRRRIRDLAADRDALDGFCYSGGFSANLLAGGACSVEGS